MTIEQVLQGLSLKTKKYYLPCLLEKKISPNTARKALIKDLIRLGFPINEKTRNSIALILEEAYGGGTEFHGRIIPTRFRSINSIIEGVLREIPNEKKERKNESRELAGCPR